MFTTDNFGGPDFWSIGAIFQGEIFVFKMSGISKIKNVVSERVGFHLFTTFRRQKSIIVNCNPYELFYLFQVCTKKEIIHSVSLDSFWIYNFLETVFTIQYPRRTVLKKQELTLTWKMFREINLQTTILF